MNVYKWDTDELEELIRKLSAQNSDLSDQVRGIETLKTEISQSWQSVAGENYKGFLDVDAQELTDFIKQISLLIDRLKKAKDSYVAGEQKIDQIVHNLVASIER